MNVLVTGGAGYIGSHTVLALEEAGHNVIIVDSMVNGHYRLVSSAATMFVVDIRTRSLETAFKAVDIDAVIHFAAFAYVGESMQEPGMYYRNNVGGMAHLLEVMHHNNVRKIVFSSSCATYGQPDTDRITETTTQRPINPYGHTKLIGEEMLAHYKQCLNFNSISLRYFNVAGADPKGRVGELHDPETHIIPLVLKTAAGNREQFHIYGDDYDTDDGTCIRDYIHVTDLANAHVKALEHLDNDHYPAYNIGTGIGHSVLDIINEVREVTGIDFSDKVIASARRPGDPDKLIADPTLANTDLGWKAQYTLTDMITHAWAWENTHGSVTNKDSET